MGTKGRGVPAELSAAALELRGLCRGIAAMASQIHCTAKYLPERNWGMTVFFFADCAAKDLTDSGATPEAQRRRDERLAARLRGLIAHLKQFPFYAPRMALRMSERIKPLAQDVERLAADLGLTEADKEIRVA